MKWKSANKCYWWLQIKFQYKKHWLTLILTYNMKNLAIIDLLRGRYSQPHLLEKKKLTEDESLGVRSLAAMGWRCLHCKKIILLWNKEMFKAWTTKIRYLLLAFVWCHLEFNIRQSSLPSHPGRSKGDNSIGCIYRAKRRFVARRNYYCAKEFESGAIRNHSWSVDQKMYEDNVSSSTRISLAQERNGGGGKVVSNENSYSDSITEKSEGNLFIQVLCFAFFHSFFFTYLKIKDNFFF